MIVHFGRTDTQNMSVLFPKPDKKTQWERGLIEAKKTMGKPFHNTKNHQSQ